DIVYGQLSMRKTKTAALGQILFLALALIIPTITHRIGLSFLVAQPMHWMILFAGLVYGPVSGGLLGLSIPLASFLISGMPAPAMLPLMLPELAVYGVLAGLLKGRTTAFGSVAIALVAGRLAFLALLALTGGLNAPALEFARATWAPGLGAMALQIALLPLLAGLFVNWARD
ncbi:MAG: hypothetical protein FWE09_03880, partial [Treponema sp.]|nr:hypothetical protein [Treponema sp.]